MTRLPFALLERYANLPESDSPTADIANRLGVSRDSVHRWRTEGIPLFSADACAVKLGVHPVTIWPDWFTISVEPAPRTGGAPCGTVRGYRRHRRNGEDCPTCRAAKAADVRRRRKAAA